MGIQKYGSIKRLRENQLYTVTFSLNGESHQFSFTSRYDPLYSTVKILRSDFPDLFSEISDDALNFIIWQTSQLAQELADEQNFTDGKPSYAVRQYTRIKSEYDVVRNILIAISTKAGSEDKQLGEFKITKEYKTPKLKDILDTLAAELAHWEAAMGKVLQSRGAIRAGRDYEYPLNPRVSF